MGLAGGVVARLLWPSQFGSTSKCSVLSFIADGGGAASAFCTLARAISTIAAPTSSATPTPTIRDTGNLRGRPQFISPPLCRRLGGCRTNGERIERAAFADCEAQLRHALGRDLAQ